MICIEVKKQKRSLQVKAVVQRGLNKQMQRKGLLQLNGMFNCYLSVYIAGRGCICISNMFLIICPTSQFRYPQSFNVNIMVYRNLRLENLDSECNELITLWSLG